MTENERARQIAGRLVTQGRMTITQIATVCDIPEAEVLAMATNYRDRTDLLHRIRTLMDDISKTQRDDAKADLICMEQHSQEIGTRRDLVVYRLETAKNDLRSARVLLNIEDYKGANNRAYYSIFHAINAVHAVNGAAYKRHKDAVANFNKDYVKTCIFPREIGRKIGQAEEIRHASDYDDFYIASKEESERQISVADEFIILAEKYCMEQLEKQKEN